MKKYALMTVMSLAAGLSCAAPGQVSPQLEFGPESAEDPRVVSVFWIGKSRAAISTGIPLPGNHVLVAKHALEDFPFERTGPSRMWVDGKRVEVRLVSWGADDGSTADWALLKVVGRYGGALGEPPPALKYSRLKLFDGQPGELPEGTPVSICGYSLRGARSSDLPDQLLGKIRYRRITARIAGHTPDLILVVTPQPGKDHGLSGGPVTVMHDGEQKLIGTIIRRAKNELELRFLGQPVARLPLGKRQREVLPVRFLVSAIGAAGAPGPEAMEAGTTIQPEALDVIDRWDQPCYAGYDGTIWCWYRCGSDWCEAQLDLDSVRPVVRAEEPVAAPSP